MLKCVFLLIPGFKRRFLVHYSQLLEENTSMQTGFIVCILSEIMLNQVGGGLVSR